MVSASSPRPWGCFRKSSAPAKPASVFPTPVGVFLAADVKSVCGRWSSPRPWGCFCPAIAWPCATWVFPTPVGVFLAVAGLDEAGVCLPHARGGVSWRAVLLDVDTRSSPRPWGCFQRGRCQSISRHVFPTPVGVFPTCNAHASRWRCLPHARGGVSPSLVQRNAGALSSPRPWGCFQNYQRRFCNHPVFPTPVGSPPYTTSVGSVDCDGHGQVNTGQPAPPANE